MRVNKIIKYPMRLLFLFFENLGPFGIKVATAQVLFYCPSILALIRLGKKFTDSNMKRYWDT